MSPLASLSLMANVRGVSPREVLLGEIHHVVVSCYTVLRSDVEKRSLRLQFSLVAP